MIEVRGLIDTDIEAVVGGVFDFGNIVIQPNIATQVGVGSVASAASTLVTLAMLASNSCLVRRASARSPKSGMPAHPFGCSGGCAGISRDRFHQPIGFRLDPVTGCRPEWTPARPGSRHPST